MDIARQAQAEAKAAIGRRWALAIGGIFALTITALFARKASRVERQSARKDAVQLALTRRNEFEARLQRALEMSKTEGPVFDLVAEALNDAAPLLRAELLLADTSRAHFRSLGGSRPER